MTATGYQQGEYAGPNTVRALDYNGHEAIGVQISDVAEDGACFLVTIDKHMQLAIAPVIAASIRSYDPPEPPSMPEIAPEDLAATRICLEDLLKMIFSEFMVGMQKKPDQLRACAIAMNELANVVEAQVRLDCGAHAAQAAGQRPALGLSAARAAQPTVRQTQSGEATK